MKQLFIREKATTLFFKDSTPFNDILNWVENEVIFNESNIFNLNERHSCNTTSGGPEIFICGDEDSVFLTLETVTTVNILNN
tara:strand:+ start:701 stop:946 length:246 start_codon:yes stop_codon:yes gene_type:complete